MPDNVVQGFWHGGALSRIEQASVKSYLKHGHRFHLYSYRPVDNVPAGAELMCAEEILPESRLFVQQNGKGAGSLTGFADLFRYALLCRRGGWWLDMDFILLKPIWFPDEIVIASERTQKGKTKRVNGAIFAPVPEHPLLKWLYRQAEGRSSGSEELGFGALGPRLVDLAIHRFPAFASSVVPPEVFCPLNYWHAGKILTPGFAPCVQKSTAIHLWNEIWRRKSWDKDLQRDPNCYLEQLLAPLDSR